MHSGRTLLVDHDIVVFRVAVVNEYLIEWAPDLSTKVVQHEQAESMVDDFLQHILEDTGCKDFICCISHDQNFRYNVLPTYKWNRADKEKPELVAYLKELSLKKYPCKVKKWLEADDVLGVMMTKWPERFVCASIDKDLLQIPGWHYNFMHPAKGVHHVSESDADRWFWRQVLTGDSTDGYPGCPGCGPKKADVYLDMMEGLDERSKWAVVLSAYAEAPDWRVKQQYKQDHPVTPEQVLQQARVARILRHTEYDFQKEEVKLWSPCDGGNGPGST